jgi:predicted  nucleic acid-binding Zn-ribbon protein
MSEERLERIESQISQLSELMMQQNTNMTAMQQNMNAMREDITVLRQRSDSIEGTMIVAMREGFNSLRNYLDDLNYDLADNERKQRRIGRRVARLERKDKED